MITYFWKLFFQNHITIRVVCLCTRLSICEFSRCYNDYHDVNENNKWLIQSWLYKKQEKNSVIWCNSKEKTKTRIILLDGGLFCRSSCQSKYVCFVCVYWRKISSVNNTVLISSRNFPLVPQKHYNKENLHFLLYIVFQNKN